MLRCCFRRSCRRPPTSLSSFPPKAPSRLPGDDASHHRRRSRTPAGPTGERHPDRAAHAVTTEADAPSGAVRLAHRLQALEQVDDNAPFDLQRSLLEDAHVALPSRPPVWHGVTGSQNGEETHSAAPQLSPRSAHVSRARPTVTAHAHDLAVFAEDDVVMRVPMSLRHITAADVDNRADTSALDELKSRIAARKAAPENKESHAEDGTAGAVRDVSWHPSARGVGQDVIDLVTDAFREQREAEVAKRRRVLYELTHPNPVDYTYNGKLVPPPPLNFGRVTDEAIQLAQQIIVDQPYSLVRKAGTRANAEAEHIASTEANTYGMLESGNDTTRRRRPGTASGTAAQPHRGRKREENIFRDHNYFFEINELYQEIVLVGKACAGKSSLLNALLDQDVAKTSSTPNTTRQISFYQSVSPQELSDFQQRERHNNLVKLPGGGRQLTFVDMPGFGIEGMSTKWRDAAIELTDAYFGVRRSVNTVLFCIDCARGLTAGDVKYFEWLENVQGVFYIVLTKCDAVSHTRLTSVMRQIYELITKKRRKFRKVFPFIIPTSARTGANVDVLRGLITETSGILPGDKLREVLQRKQASTTTAALAKEAQRLLEARELEKAEAKRFFAQTQHRSASTTARAVAVSDDATHAQPRAITSTATSHSVTDDKETHTKDDDDDVFVPLDMPTREADTTVSLFIGQTPRGVNTHPATHPAAVTHGTQPSRPAVSSSGSGGGHDESTAESEADTAAHRSRHRRREEFLRWREANPLEYEETPYGKVRFRLNTGLENPASEVVTFASEPGGSSTDPPAVASPAATESDEPRGPALPVVAASSAVIGLTGEDDTPVLTTRATTHATATGQVSRFLDVVNEYGSRVHEPRGRRTAREKEARWRRHYAPRFLAEDSEGRLSEFTAGKKTGPSLVHTKTRVDQRKAEWKAQQLKALLQAECPDAPWSSLPRLTKKINALKDGAGLAGPRMRKKDVAAYLKNAGRITESFEQFEGEVTTATYMNEVRQAKTLRSQQQMHLNATSKINYRAMPPGLWKAYGQKETYWPTPRVLGREQDESHKGK